MPLPPDSARRGRRFALGLVIILSLGLGPVAHGQFLDYKKPDPKKPATEEGMATWYPVPSKSLAKKRAGKDELTAAHNKLPIGTKVRVTHLKNGKNVVVRITDRGVHKRGVVVDLCKEAAEKLDMISEGSARIRLEVLPEDQPAKSPSWRWW
jgi:rare lipoprotein A